VLTTDDVHILMISYDDFAKLELRVATITAAERVEGSEKLVKLQLDVGEFGSRQIVAGIGKVYAPDQLVNTQIIIVANLEPRALMGIESAGLLLAAGGQDGASLLRPDRPTPPGSKIN
jgi:methionyl-tRNA synthetase